jgi:branched-chain amino acid transport system ATP-binding protein
MTAALKVEGASVHFGGVVALESVDLAIDSGIITGLIGPNGAGKTTLVDVITGFERATAGRIFLRDVDISTISAWRRARLGISRTFQGAELFDDLTVRENIDVGARNARIVDQLLSEFGLTEFADTPAEDVPTGLRRIVGLARAAATQPQVLLLDEPGAGLLEEERHILARLITQLAGEQDISVLLIDHDFDLISLTCAHVVVLNFGKVLAAGTPQEIRANESVLEAYLGTE